MRLITVNLPEEYVVGLERLISEELYPNRSEAIRIAIRDLLKRELWGQTTEQMETRVRYFG
ncbi:MAG: ribbon-helix-helix domain-containing protein [Promethearchaeota archaeon]